MKVRIRVEGGDELAKALRGLPERVQGAALLDALHTAAAPIRAAAASLAPRAPGLPDLAADIQQNAVSRIGTPAGDRWQVRERTERAVAIGPSSRSFYGLYQEYGTVRHGAKPFLRPAFERGKAEAVATISRVLWSKLKRRGVV